MQRLDKLLLARGLARSRTHSQSLIKKGLVEVCDRGIWRRIEKPSTQYGDITRIRILKEAGPSFVSRAGVKLDHAIQTAGLTVAGTALDIGQSTGGFTDCLLARGADHVVGVEVGHNQLVEVLRSDSRVTCLEGVNARYLEPELFSFLGGKKFDWVVMDVSFISQTLILDRIPPCLTKGAYFISLVKPQFEVGKAHIGKGGIVTDVRQFTRIKSQICAAVEALGFTILNYLESPIQGGDGNTEFLLVAQYV